MRVNTRYINSTINNTSDAGGIFSEFGWWLFFFFLKSAVGSSVCAHLYYVGPSFSSNPKALRNGCWLHPEIKERGKKCITCTGIPTHNLFNFGSNLQGEAKRTRVWENGLLLAFSVCQCVLIKECILSTLWVRTRHFCKIASFLHQPFT